MTPENTALSSLSIYRSSVFLYFSLALLLRGVYILGAVRFEMWEVYFEEEVKTARIQNGRCHEPARPYSVFAVRHESFI